MKQASSSSPKVQSKKWLREASMNRLSTFMKNKTELIGNAAQLGMGVIAVDDLEKSGLSPTEIFHLEQWVAGVETGRHCMLAILDERFNDKDVESASSSSSSTFQPIELIKTSMNLPQDFLCDSGFVYETVFKRPPTSVIREALQMLSSKAFEKSAQGLNAHQINIAIKQLRIDYLADDRSDPSKAASDDVEDGNDENVSHNTPRDSSDTKTSIEASTPVAKASEHTFKLQVMIELIRMHIIANNAKLKADQRSSSSAASRSTASATTKDNWNPAISSDSESVSDAYVSDGADSEDSQDSLDELFDDLPEFIQKGLRSSKPSKSRKTKKSKKPVDNRKSLFSKSSNATAEMKTQFARDLVNKRTTDNDESSTAGAAASAERIDIRTLEYHLNTPLQSVQEQAASLTNEDIEYSNQLLKPYLKKLASLKTVLTTQLKDLQESRAYLCLGVTPDASDEAIKKAYRLMAIKLHPDKAGGSTVKFQQLQDHYHEILKRRQNNKTERRAFSEVRKQEKSQQKQKTAAFRAAKGLDPEQEEDELNTEDEELMSGEKKKKTGHNRKRASSSDGEAGSDSESEEEEEKSSKSNPKGKSEEAAAPSSSSSKKQSSKTVESDAEEEEDVEDVHISVHEDDEEIDPTTGETKRDQRAKAAAAEKAASQNSEYIKNKKRALKKQIKEGSYSSFTEFAQAIADSILELLVTIKQSAGDITTLAQYNIKLHKAVLTISTTQAHPVSIREIMKLMKSTSLSATLGTPAGEAQVTSDLCSLSNAVGPIELICELCQSICSSAMRLSSECGVHYAKQVATNRSFLATVEETMNNSLKSLKMVMQCMSSQDQFYTALRRVQDSFQLSLESEEISDLLIEMLTTALQSNVLTITNTVDRIVETSLNVSNVYELVLDTIRETEHQIQQQVRREASQRETEEAEEDFCEEDKELLRQSRANQRQQQQQKEKEQSEQQQKAENKKAEKKSDEEEDEDENSLTNLKDKIRALQIQLRIQHISTLQNMNKDILGLQSNIISEIKDLPFIQSWEALFKTPASSKEKNAQQTEKNASSGDFHTSIMTLLSTLLDSSCLAIRDELKAASDLASGHFCLRSDSHFRGVIIKHLGWTSIVLSDGTKDLLSSHILNRLFSAETTSASSPPEAASSSSGAAPSSASFKARLALYPEYKTKILYMASVVDVDTVKDIIGTELFQRLDELLFEANGQKRLSQASAPASSPSSPSVKDSMAVEASETVSHAAVEEKCAAAPVTEKKSQSLDESFDIDCTVADVGPEATSETLFDDVDGEIFSSYVSPATKSTTSGGFVHITSEQAFNAAEADEVDEEERDITGNDDSEAEDATSSYADVQQPESPVSAEDSYEAPDTEVEEAFSEEERERPLAASSAMAAEDEEEFGASLGDREADEVPAMYSYYQQKARSSTGVRPSEHI